MGKGRRRQRTKLTFFLFFLHLPGKLLIYKASLYYVKHPFMYIYIPLYTIFIDRRTQHCRDVNAPPRNPPNRPTHTLSSGLKTVVPRGTNYVLFLNLGPGYTGVQFCDYSTSCPFIRCTLRFVYYTSTKSLFLIPF